MNFDDTTCILLNIHFREYEMDREDESKRMLLIESNKTVDFKTLEQKSHDKVRKASKKSGY